MVCNLEKLASETSGTARTSSFSRPPKTHLSRRSLLAKTDPPSKNRVGGFQKNFSVRARIFPSQPVETVSETSSVFTETASGVLFYGYRYYIPELGRWPSRDPIEEMGGLNVYGFVRNSPFDDIDFIGLMPRPTSFLHCIMVTDRKVRTIFWHNHYALERWVGCCPPLGSEIEISKWKEINNIIQVDKMELLNITDPVNEAWKWTGSKWKYEKIGVSVIFYAFPQDNPKSESAMSIFLGDRTIVNTVWNNMKNISRLYEWGEQENYGGTFVHFPKSVYRYGMSANATDQFHNSNTYVRHVAGSLMRELSGSHPGRRTVDNTLTYNNIYKNPNQPHNQPVGAP
jgi:RHS repeat-associated protein